MNINKEDFTITFECASFEGANKLFKEYSEVPFIEDKIEIEEKSNKVHIECHSIDDSICSLSTILCSLVPGAKDIPLLQAFFLETKEVSVDIKETDIKV